MESIKFEFFRYSVTTIEPGASEVLTHGFLSNPRSLAFFATRPAAIITLGLDVFVQDVIAAITTSPFLISKFFPSKFIWDELLLLVIELTSFWYDSFAFFKSILSCGLFGPAIEGEIVDISSSKFSEYFALLQSSLVSPTFSEYFFISSIWDSSLFDSFIYSIVSSSIGKIPHVAPYSGAMFAIVALSPRDKLLSPSP